MHSQHAVLSIIIRVAKRDLIAPKFSSPDPTSQTVELSATEFNSVNNSHSTINNDIYHHTSSQTW